MLKTRQEKYKPQRSQSSQRKTGTSLLIVKKALTSLSVFSVFSVVKSSFYPVFCLLSSVFLFASIGYGAEEHGVHHAEFNPLTEAFRIINFLVVFGTLYYLLSKHIKNFFIGRREDIVKSLNDAEQLKLSAGKRLSDCESKIKEMKDTVRQMAEDAGREAEHTKDNIIRSANESAKKTIEKAKREIEYETKIVMERLRVESLELTIKLAENILKKSVTKNDHVSMVNEYIKGIGTEARLG
jgi:F-type H+-transporting ATPase subunit b